MMTEITGKDLIDAGANPGKWFKAAIECANRLIAEGSPVAEVIPAVIAEFQPAPHLPLRSVVPMFQMNIRADTPHKVQNVTNVFGTIEVLTRTTVATDGSMMSDACHAVPLGPHP